MSTYQELYVSKKFSRCNSKSDCQLSMINEQYQLHRDSSNPQSKSTTENKCHRTKLQAGQGKNSESLHPLEYAYQKMVNDMNRKNKLLETIRRRNEERLNSNAQFTASKSDSRLHGTNEHYQPHGEGSRYVYNVSSVLDDVMEDELSSTDYEAYKPRGASNKEVKYDEYNRGVRDKRKITMRESIRQQDEKKVLDSNVQCTASEWEGLQAERGEGERLVRTLKERRYEMLELLNDQIITLEEFEADIKSVIERVHKDEEDTETEKFLKNAAKLQADLSMKKNELLQYKRDIVSPVGYDPLSLRQSIININNINDNVTVSMEHLTEEVLQVGIEVSTFNYVRASASNIIMANLSKNSLATKEQSD